MKSGSEDLREVVVPASALAALARALHSELDVPSSVRALQTAGYGAGGPVYENFARGFKTPVEAAPDGIFWASLNRFMDRRGWGRLAHSAPHPGVGLLSSPDWAEASGESGAQRSCAFSAGLLAHLLSRVAQAPVAVLEVSCRGRGEVACGFAFGSEATIQELYGGLLEGRRLDHALREL